MAIGEQLREKVLVVDDELAILTALEDALGDNFDVVATDKPERAVELAENDPELAVVLSDQRMPGMTGDALFSRIRNRSDATRVLATGYADLSAVIRAVNDGNLFGYITKPWNRNDLNLSVQRAAEHFRLRRRLFEEHLLLENLMQNMPDAIYFQDGAQRFTRVNEAFLRLLGTDEQAVVGRAFSDLQAALGASQMARLPLLTEQRNQRAARYRDLLAGLPLELPPTPAPGERHAYHLFAIRVDGRRRIYDGLRRAGIGAQVHFVPIHHQPLVAELGPWDLPETDRAYERLLSIPMMPDLTDAEQDLVVDTLRSLL